MTTPSIRDSFNEVGITKNTYNMPATVAAGDLLLLVMSLDSTPTITSLEPGWTELVYEGYRDSLLIVYKDTVADGTEGSTSIGITFSTSETKVYSSFSIQDAADPAITPPEAAPVATTGISTDPAPPPSPINSANDYLYLATASWHNGGGTLTAYPAGYTTSQGNGNAGGAGGTGLAWAFKPTIGTTSDAPGPFTISTSYDWGAQTVSIHPSNGGPPPPTGTKSLTASKLLNSPLTNSPLTS